MNRRWLQHYATINARHCGLPCAIWRICLHRSSNSHLNRFNSTLLSCFFSLIFSDGMADSDQPSGHSADPNMVLTLVYFVTIAAVLIGTAVYFFIMDRISDPEREVQHLIDNLSSQFTNFFRLPLRWQSMKPYYTHHTLSWLFILTLTASAVALIVSLALNLPEVIRISTFTFMFSPFEWSVFNVVQIAILIIEFLQLLSFPIRDLLASINLGNQKDTADFIFYIIQLWFLVGVIGCVGLAIGVIHGYNIWRPHKPIALYWVKYILPLANLLYLPMLVMLIGSASCLSKIGTADYKGASSGLLRCSDPSVNKPLYLLVTVVAYTAACFCQLTSLVSNSYMHIRSIMSLIIVLSMVCFNISTQPCFVDQINYWRTYGLCSILWVGLIVTMLTNEDETLNNISTGGIASTLAVGVVVLLVVFIIVKRINLNSRKNSALSAVQDVLVEGSGENGMAFLQKKHLLADSLPAANVHEGCVVSSEDTKI
ncbi:hypothetical protein BX661DRAFT_177601 [Kickxella alabastrina]|uniref:uncharacterized protein n=1 Tax=Kickxella alabastrina TaxID=61397 RepID=UPI00221F8078|nr:uncharacterized protein BX661DRAFT_177601 [Kickxella alabastrina]KAI7833816.1 hypothetical protein BX661DRAFT_177601 [Kickxella alabastrina]